MRNDKVLDHLKKRANDLQTETYALYLAYRDPRTPWPVKVVALLVLAYAVSPIDLIPDFIPVLGYLDDLIIVPAGIALVLKMIPAEVMADSRGKAKAAKTLNIKTYWIGAVIVLAIWLGLLSLVIYIVIQLFKKTA